MVKMKVLGLVSGGKDSCYNLIECAREGHEIVALGNLKPAQKDELDSFMYQTVGHDVIDLYADALGLPLFRRVITGKSINTDLDYQCIKEDEVEDLNLLLQTVKETVMFDAVAVGAILSDYQRIRVENVCSRLGITCLSYLWRRDQDELLQDMIDSKIHAILIKVATLGLLPQKHLMLSIEQAQNHLREMNAKFGINICGEGGEYETMTIDCPLFLKKIVIDDFEVIIHSDDAFAPVGYIKFKTMHLEDKGIDPRLSLKERLHQYQYPSRLLEKMRHRTFIRKHAEELSYAHSKGDKEERIFPFVDTDISVSSAKKSGRNVYITGISCDKIEGEDTNVCIKKTFESLRDVLFDNRCTFDRCVRLHLYLHDMDSFSIVNDVYKEYFKMNPPARVCLEVPMPENRLFSIECQAIDCHSELECKVPEMKTLHVQSISHWAPANIGPYSQAKKVGSFIFVSGSLGFDSGSMLIVPGGVEQQAEHSLRHTDSVLQAIEPSCCLKDAILITCYIVNPGHESCVKNTFEKRFGNEINSCTVFKVITVSRLPRDALVEWSVVGHKCPEGHIKEFHFDTQVHGTVISCKASRCSCENKGILSLSISQGEVDDSIWEDVVSRIQESIKRLLVHGELKDELLLAVQLYHNLESQSRLQYLSDCLQKSFRTAALSLIRTKDTHAQLDIVGYIL